MDEGAIVNVLATAFFVAIVVVGVGKLILGRGLAKPTESPDPALVKPLPLVAYAGYLLFTFALYETWCWYRPDSRSSPSVLFLFFAFNGAASWRSLPHDERRRRQAVAVAINVVVVLLDHAILKSKPAVFFGAELLFAAVFPFVITIPANTPLAFWHKPSASPLLHDPVSHSLYGEDASRGPN